MSHFGCLASEGEEVRLIPEHFPIFFVLPLLHLELLGQENERGERQSQAGSDGKSRARRN